ncbi:MAG: hypothetical protein CL693_18380 [Cellvibrionaceae bacterium]|nr:hypothetical protein [Cellvibrionaceae bacterium]
MAIQRGSRASIAPPSPRKAAILNRIELLEQDEKSGATMKFWRLLQHIELTLIASLRNRFIGTNTFITPLGSDSV